MKGKFFKVLLTAIAIIFFSSGATPVGKAIYDAAGVETQARAEAQAKVEAQERAESTVSFNEKTGTLILLKGEVSIYDLRRYASNSDVIKVYAMKGCVFPMNCMHVFDGYKALAFELEKADTSKVRYMTGMFGNCENLLKLDISGFNTSNVTDMQSMFVNCSSLKNLDVSGFDTSNVTDMSYMFAGCSGLSELDVSRFNTSNVTDMTAMFAACENLRTIYASYLWNLDNLARGTNMFLNSYSLVGGKGTKYNDSNTGSSYARIDKAGKPGYFTGCVSFDEWGGTLYLRSYVSVEEVREYAYNDAVNRVYAFEGTVFPNNCAEMFWGFKAKTMNLSNVDTSNVTNMDSMFCECGELSELDINFETSNVKYMGFMFANCSGLNQLDITSFRVSNVLSMSAMFANCSGLSELDFTWFDTENVRDMSGMFTGCSGLTKLDVSGFDTSNVTDMSYMFYNCSSLSELNVSGFDTSNVTDMKYMFYGCSGLTKLDVSGFDTSNVTSMGKMFSFSSSLNELDVSGFDTSNVTDMSQMFGGCSSLSKLDLSGFDTSNVTDMFLMFSTCDNLKTIIVSDLWNLDKVTGSGSMFFGCSSLVGGNGTTYDYMHTDALYARIDSEGKPGYFTAAQKTEIVITKQPRDWYGTIGKKANFSVEATGDDLSYEWQYRKSGEWFAYGITSYDTANFSVSMNTKNIKWPIRCVITDKYGQQAITREVWLKDSSVSAPITITKQPVDWTGVIGKKAKFSVAATGNGLTYQWQYKKGTGAWTDYAIATADTANFSVAMNEKNVKWLYRCLITDEDGYTITTNEVKMLLEEDVPFAITVQPADFTGTIGKKASFSVTATGAGLSYQWQYKKGTADWTDYAIATADTANFSVSMNEKNVKWLYRCRITNGSGEVLYTNEVRMKVKEAFAITQQPGDFTGKTGKKATFTVTATGEGLTYEWQVKKATTWSAYALAGYDTPTFQVSISDKTAKWTYRCVIRDASGNELTTNEVHIYVTE